MSGLLSLICAKQDQLLARVMIELCRNVSSGLHTTFLWIHDSFCCLLLSCSVNLVLLKRAGLAASSVCPQHRCTAGSASASVPALPLPHASPWLGGAASRGEGRVWTPPSLLRLPTSVSIVGGATLLRLLNRFPLCHKTDRQERTIVSGLCWLAEFEQIT